MSAYLILFIGFVLGAIVGYKVSNVVAMRHYYKSRYKDMEKIVLNLVDWLSSVDEDYIRIQRMKNWVFYFTWFIIWVFSIWSVFIISSFILDVSWLVIIQLVRDIYN